MKRFLLVALALYSAVYSYGQTGFYKNFWGTQVPPTYNVPILCSLDTTSDKGFIITTTNQQMGNVSYLKLDSNFQEVWTTNYVISNTGFLDRAVELDDKGFVGIYNYDFNNYCFSKQDANGNPQFSNYYHTASSTNFASSAICKSSSNDTGFVVMYSGCVLHYGIAKFDKTGNVQWCYDYSTNGFYASTYELIPGMNTGYLTCGNHFNSSINHYAAIVAQFDNNGNVMRSKEFILDSARNSYMDNAITAVDNHYYNIGYTQQDAPTYANDHWIYLNKLDSNLNLVKSWKLFPPILNSRIVVENMLSMPDSTIIINGKTTDTLQGSRMFYIMKFNPKGNGNVVWCKSWTSPLIQINTFSTTETGLFTFGTNANLVTPALSNYDGACIVGLDSAGNGLCNSLNENITTALHSRYSSSAVNFYQLTIPLLKYPMTMTLASNEYQDTMLCGTLPNAIHEIPNVFAQENLIIANSQNGNLSITNLSDSKVGVEIYNITGQLVKQILLTGNESFTTEIGSNGLYFVRANSTEKFQVEKILIEK